MSEPHGVLEEKDGLFKDSVLAALSSHANVAQFVSFAPGNEPSIRYVCIHDAARADITTVEEGVAKLLHQSAEASVNVRAFDPHQPKSHEFIYGLTEAEAAVGHIRRLARTGLHTIVNETIDVGDGGVSGVAYGGVIEFAPEDTPRCVEKPGVASFPRRLGLRILETVYGFRPELDQPDDVRVEFSVHPTRRGVRSSHTILWEEEHTEPVRLGPKMNWPNRFSRFLGDKAFGLLVADAAGMAVPETTVVARRVAAFRFGTSTGSGEKWIRTCPVEPQPGLFTTHRGWLDPFALLEREDPNGNKIASVLAQEGIAAAFSGAAATDGDSSVTIVEGVRGQGDSFMLGEMAPEVLPLSIVAAVEETLQRASGELGPVRVEWVHDGQTVWIVQLHRGETPSRGGVIYPGHPTREHRFEVERGLEALRSMAQRVAGTGEGILLVGHVGVTSHFGDVLRAARIPSRLETDDEEVTNQSRFDRG